MDELLVEIGAQAAQFLLVAKSAGGDLLVIGGGEDPIVELGGRSESGRFGRTGSMPSSPSSPSPSEESLELVLGPFALALRRRRCGGPARADLGLAAAAGFVVLVLLVLVAALGFLLALAVVAGVGIEVRGAIALDQFEIAQQLGRERREGRLVVDGEAERI